jgi:hypothetical protein
MNTPLLSAVSLAPSTRPAAAPRFHALRSWLGRMRSRRARLVADLDRDRAAHEACASEGVALEVRSIDLDGRRFEALYRHGELICLLPDPARN